MDDTSELSATEFAATDLLVSDWLDSALVPVRDGLYQREVKTEPGRVYWSLYKQGVWRMLCTDADQAAMQTDPSDYQAGTDGLFSWRGLAAEPNA